MKKVLIVVITLTSIASFTFIIGRRDIYFTSPKIKTEVNRARVKVKLDNSPIKLIKLNRIMPNIDELDEYIQRIVGYSGESYFSRSQIIWDLKKRTLQEADFIAIMTFLETRPKKEGAQLGWHSLKNDLLVFLIEDGRYKESTAQLMIEIISDPYQHEVMREYTLQYTTDYFDRHFKGKKELSKLDEEIINLFLNSMWKCVESVQGSIAGTALIRLNDLSEDFPSIDNIQIEKATKDMIADESTPSSSRMAALSIVEERQMIELAENINFITFDTSNTIPLRMAALHTSTTLVPDSEFKLKLVKEIIDNKDANRLLKRAAQLALVKLK